MHDAKPLLHPATSGDGFVTLADGSRRWGRFGAAGLLVRHTGGDGEPSYFLARRSEHCHRGGTWAIPGGALDLGEPPLVGALREFHEEVGVALDRYQVDSTHEDDHGGWSYWTMVVDIRERFPAPTELNWETDEVRWVRRHELARLDLLDHFRAMLERIGLLWRPS